ncbi:hypothetical protein KVV02_003184 [Mortierella alpina]|uniref:Uncharacterized protein n=1 Tax=Mortierella alpina TaxID=64518 RepID=A0A9P8A176_MORAP|nr:hypothetical protein KVV02_003184 [Mortierella alpina]
MSPKSRETVHSDIESSDDEGVIKNLDYKPPKGFTVHRAKKHTTSVFDVDETVQHELWLIRVPEGVSNEDLASMSITLPPTTPSKESDESFTLGTLKKKETSSSTNTSSTTKYQLRTVPTDSGFAGEMLALQPLVPDSSKGGRLVQAPLGIRHHLALVAQPTIPSGEPLADEILSRPIPKREQPEGLKMRFKFSGMETQVPGVKLSGSGKKFAEQWAKTLEKRQREQEEDLIRAQQAEAEEAVEDEDQVEAEAEEDVVATEEAQEAPETSSAPAKKRKNEQAEVDGEDEKKVKKEKKSKKEKRDKEKKDKH